MRIKALYVLSFRQNSFLGGFNEVFQHLELLTHVCVQNLFWFRCNYHTKKVPSIQTCLPPNRSKLVKCTTQTTVTSDHSAMAAIAGKDVWMP